MNAQISPKRPVSLKNIESVQEEIKKMGNLLSANDWRTRQKGLEAFKEMCEISPGIVTANITQVTILSLQYSLFFHIYIGNLLFSILIMSMWPTGYSVQVPSMRAWFDSHQN